MRDPRTDLAFAVEHVIPLTQCDLSLNNLIAAEAGPQCRLRLGREPA